MSASSGSAECLESVSLDALAANPALAGELPRDDAAQLYAATTIVQAVLLLRLLTLPKQGASSVGTDDELLGVKGAAAILNQPAVSLRHHARVYPFAFKRGTRWKFSRRGIQEWIVRETKHGWRR